MSRSFPDRECRALCSFSQIINRSRVLTSSPREPSTAPQAFNHDVWHRIVDLLGGPPSASAPLRKVLR